MKQNLISSQSLCAFPSPGGAKYQDNNGWSSERIPHPSSGSSRRNMSALTPFYGGRALPSKWEDAERWVCSPVLGYGVAKSSQCHPLRRAKSKSGPINVPPGIGYYQNYSPSMGALDGGIVRSFMVSSPFSTGVLMPNGVGSRYSGSGARNSGLGHVERLASGPGWSDMASEGSSSSSQGEKTEGIDDANNTVDRIISRRDMATQMSPVGSSHSSCRGSSSSTPSISPVLAPASDHPGKLDIREFQVDKRATVIRWSERPGSRRIKRGQPDVKDFNPNAADAHSSSLDISEAVSDFSKLQREEAKITAWENLQKARAEAAIRKLEMNLEKKRSSSMDKIMNKLRTTHMKAEEMRSSMSNRQDSKVSQKSCKVKFFHKHARLSSLGSCFTSCHAF
ncbi:REMORIN FAMILY PROTEIN [Salix viminalis]|uniref:REMORIN FAMILY PROTEIN n=1 Tax=Salix viminalis TaxID=40686 RepID=A0A9Q0NYR1_SALVM|nr:REMORIN FAMILY PROTEIN [Salix viminalis]